MTPQQAQLVERLRASLVGEASLREVSMFGGRSFMLEERMIVSALKSGDLLVRVAADQHDELTAIPGASQATMGAGRTMGRGWISVGAATIASDDQLSCWIDVARAHHRAATGTDRW